MPGSEPRLRMKILHRLNTKKSLPRIRGVHSRILVLSDMVGSKIHALRWSRIGSLCVSMESMYPETLIMSGVTVRHLC